MTDKDAQRPDLHDVPVHEFSYPLDITAVSPAGRTYTLNASASERQRVAARLGLQRVDDLNAVIEVKVGLGGFIEVSGQFIADVVQTCGVTLAPVAARCQDVIRATFITEERAFRDKVRRDKARAKGEEEEVFEVDQDDPPEVARGGRIDLGEVAVAHLALALDSYPRAPGATFDPQVWGLEAEKDAKPRDKGPFAALAKLKPPGPGPGKG